MERTLRSPILIATLGFIAGGILLGTVAASAAPGQGQFGQKGGEVAAQVLGVDEQEIRDLRGSGVSFEEFVLEHGFSSIEDFQASMQATLVEKWQADGVSEEDIASRLDRMEERQARGEAHRAVVADLLGLSEDELKASRQAGEKIEDLLDAAGYEDRQAFHEAVQQKLEEQGIESNGPGFAGGPRGGRQGMHQGQQFGL